MKRIARLAGILLISFAALFLENCNDNNNRFRRDFSPSPPPFDTTQAVADTTLPGNVKVYTLKKGRDTFQVTSQDQPLVRYTARTADGKIVDGTYTTTNSPNYTGILNNLSPYPKLIPGTNRTVPPTIKGFRKGLIGMKEGEKRTIVVPPEQGYGVNRRGPNGFDVRGDVLIYDVELVSL